MKQVNLEKFKRNIGKELKDLPFEITKRGKVIAVVLVPNRTVQTLNRTAQDTKQNKDNLNRTVQSTNRTVQNVITSPAEAKEQINNIIETKPVIDKSKYVKGKFQTFFKEDKKPSPHKIDKYNSKFKTYFK